MTLSATFNLQTLSYAELKNLYSRLLKQLTHKLLSRDQANLIAAQILDIQREIYVRVNTA